MYKKISIFIIVILQLLFLSGMIFFHQYKVHKGTIITLETVPVDPLSIFRGRYVVLNYKISTIPATLLKDCEINTLKAGDVIYIALQKKDIFWEPIAAYKNKPQQDEMVYLKGKVQYPSSTIRINYGIESFFLSEDSANEIENRRRNFGSRNWQEIQKQRDERIKNLGEEEQRILRAGVRDQWYNTLEKEIIVWSKEKLITEKQAAKIKEKYTQALAKIKEAENVPAQQTTRPTSPLTVEITVAKDGTGYPTKLFLEGKEYK